MSPPSKVRSRCFRHARRQSPVRQLLVTGVVVAAVFLACLVTVVGKARLGGETPVVPAADDRRQVDGRVREAPRDTSVFKPTDGPKRITYPQRGSGAWVVAPGHTAVAGTSGTLLRYRVAVENGIKDLDVAAFAGEVSGTLGDPRSWTGTGRFRLQRVDAGRRADFVIYLATPRTRGELCGSTDTYTSCRNGDRVVLNVARWTHGAEAFTGNLASYRQYVVNHEVGHRLGRGHELCPGRGEPAPVMQQQTLGLHGCRPGSWPLRDGDEYHGPAGAYDDPTPDNNAT